MKIFDEMRRRNIQKDVAKMSMNRVELEMRMKTQQQALQALQKHVMDQYQIIVPDFWRKISDFLPPPLWFKFWHFVAQVPNKLIYWLFIRTGMYLHSMVWKCGTYAQTDKLSEFVWRVRMWRFFKLVYKCDWDWRYNKPTEVVKSRRIYNSEDK